MTWKMRASRSIEKTLRRSYTIRPAAAPAATIAIQLVNNETTNINAIQRIFNITTPTFVQTTTDQSNRKNNEAQTNASREFEHHYRLGCEFQYLQDLNDLPKHHHLSQRAPPYPCRDHLQHQQPVRYYRYFLMC